MTLEFNQNGLRLAKNGIVPAFQTLPACDLINLTLFPGSTYAESVGKR